MTKKSWLTLLASTVVGALAPWLTAAQTAHPIPFTFATVGVPAIVTLATAVLHLFQPAPSQS